jgi:hypothetical protein
MGLSKREEKIMDQRDIKIKVQALWLQYSGLKAGFAGKCDWIGSTARTCVTQLESYDMPREAGLIVAT